MKVILTVALLAMPAVAQATERPFWQWFSKTEASTTGHDVNVSTSTPDGRASATASASGPGTNEATVNVHATTNGGSFAASVSSSRASASVSNGTASASVHGMSSAHAGP